MLLVALTIPSFEAAADLRTSSFRWVGWVLLLGAAGPMFLNELGLKLRILFWARRLVVVCAIGSLAINLVGIRLNGRGAFPGLMSHSMLLAPVSALAVIDLFGRQQKQYSQLRLIMLVLCCLACIGAGSRGSVIALAAGVSVHIASRREGLYLVVLAAVGLMLVSYVELNRANYTDRLGNSVFAELAEKGTNNTREQLWGFRLEEFMANPVNGVGFQQQRLYRAGTEREFLEPGSSYLAILSMTGVIGATGFIWLAICLFRALATSSCVPDRYRDLLRGWMAFFAVHFVVEGYVFACGSLLCMLFWLSAGCSLSLHHQGRRARMMQRHRRRMAAQTGIRKAA